LAARRELKKIGYEFEGCFFMSSWAKSENFFLKIWEVFLLVKN